MWLVSYMMIISLDKYWESVGKPFPHMSRVSSKTFTSLSFSKLSWKIILRIDANLMSCNSAPLRFQPVLHCNVGISRGGNASSQHRFRVVSNTI